jgi:hypothetical protein
VIQPVTVTVLTVHYNIHYKTIDDDEEEEEEDIDGMSLCL